MVNPQAPPPAQSGRDRGGRVGQQLTIEAFQAIREVKLLDLSATSGTGSRPSRRRWAHALRQSSTIVAAPRTVIETVAFAALITLVAYRGQSDGGTALAGVGVLGYAVIRILPSANNMVTHINTVRSGQPSMHRLLEALRPDEDVRRATATLASTTTHGLRSKRSTSTSVIRQGQEILAGIDLRLVDRVQHRARRRNGMREAQPCWTCSPDCSTQHEAGAPQRCSARRVSSRSWWEPSASSLRRSHCSMLRWPRTSRSAFPPAAVDPSALHRAVRPGPARRCRRDDMPEGSRTPIGERGVRLSGRATQRVAIAQPSTGIRR